MSVLIKGMTMPDKCLECDFLSGLICPDGIYVCECPSTNIYERNVQRAIEEDSRHPDCPFVEVPEPHGRLIDEAIILEMIRKSMGIKDLSFLYHAEKSIVNEIYHAPTVIEAEGEE